MPEENKQNSQPPANTEGDDSLDQAAPAASTSPAPAGEATPASPSPTPTPEPESKESAKDKAKTVLNLYFIIYIVLVLVAAGIIFFAVSASKKASKGTVQHAPSLTSQQLASLKGNTTIVGDSKQTLDVQSNSVFEGQVLVRSDLSVAGGLKLGGSLSIPSITVPGTATLGGTQVNGTFGVTGDTTLQGALTIQKGLSVAGAVSFGSLSVSSLSTSSLQLTGDLSLSRHIVTNGTSVNRSPGTALGGGGTVSVSGTDIAGTVTVNTGNSPGAGLFVTVNFAQKYANTPKVMITPVGSAAGGIPYYVNRDVNGFSIGTSSPPPAGSSFSFDYFVIN